MTLRMAEEVSTQVPADDFQALEDKIYRTIELYKSAQEARATAERDVKRLREQLEEREEETRRVDERDEPDHRRTFDAACAELGLGANADDNARREQLAKVILGLAQQGERDPIALQQYAVRMMQGGG